jgi:hypothetical protein
MILGVLIGAILDLFVMFVWAVTCGNRCQACSCDRVRWVNKLSDDAGPPHYGDPEADPEGATRTNPRY